MQLFKKLQGVTVIRDWPDLEELEHFNSLQEALDAGYAKSQVWAIADGEDGGCPWLMGVYTYGPAFHKINVWQFVATREHHDGKTYIECHIERDDPSWFRDWLKDYEPDQEALSVLASAYLDWRYTHELV